MNLDLSLEKAASRPSRRKDQKSQSSFLEIEMKSAIFRGTGVHLISSFLSKYKTTDNKCGSKATSKTTHISSLQQMKSPVFVKALRFRFLTNRCHPTEAATSNNDVGRHFRQHLEPSGKLLLLTIVNGRRRHSSKIRPPNYKFCTSVDEWHGKLKIDQMDFYVQTSWIRLKATVVYKWRKILQFAIGNERK